MSDDPWVSVRARIAAACEQVIAAEAALEQANAELHRIAAEVAGAPLDIIHALYWRTAVEVQGLAEILGCHRSEVGAIVGPCGTHPCPECGTDTPTLSRADRKLGDGSLEANWWRQHPDALGCPGHLRASICSNCITTDDASLLGLRARRTRLHEAARRISTDPSE